MVALIFKQADYQQILQRINKLTPQHTSLWGKMNLPQMLEHCSIQLKKAMSILPANDKRGPAFFRSVVGRWLLLYIIPWPKGSATPEGMNMETNGVLPKEFGRAKEQLISLLNQIQQQEAFQAHPFFGVMNKKDWGRLVWKHLDHHLRQFGV